jgi:hypothetical protein
MTYIWTVAITAMNQLEGQVFTIKAERAYTAAYRAMTACKGLSDVPAGVKIVVELRRSSAPAAPTHRRK